MNVFQNEKISWEIYKLTGIFHLVVEPDDSTHVVVNTVVYVESCFFTEKNWVMKFSS